MKPPSRGWEAARSLADLGALTAGWIEGDVPQHPCYAGPPDAETALLRRHLACLNRAGLVTDFSQPGARMVDGCGQRAAVAGYCAERLARRIAALGVFTDLIVLAFPPDAWQVEDGGYQLPITLDGYRPCTWLGRCPATEELEWFARVCSPDAMRALREAWWVGVIDPKWGRRDYLWRWLAKAVSSEHAFDPFDVTPPEAIGCDFVY